MKNMQNKELVKKIRNAAIVACIEKGTNNPVEVREYLQAALNTISPMSVAGVRAAITKGEKFYAIEQFDG